MSESLDLFLNMQTNDARIELANLRAEMDRVAIEARDKRQQIVAEINQTMGVFNMSLRMFRNIFVALGGVITPVQEAALNIISGTVVTMQQVAVAYATMGPIGWGAAAIIGAATIAFNIMTQAAMLQDMEQAKRQMSAATAAVGNMQSIFSTIGRGF